jgi:hypothetical protein
LKKIRTEIQVTLQKMQQQQPIYDTDDDIDYEETYGCEFEDLILTLFLIFAGLSFYLYNHYRK